MKRPKKKSGGLLSIKNKQTLSDPPKKIDDAATNKIDDDEVIKERVIAINAKDLEGIAVPIETGKMLLALDEEIAHGKWRPLFKGCDKKGYLSVEPAEVQFRFGERRAQMLMAIARDPFCSDPHNYADLPLSWNGLYDAVQKIPKELPRLFASGKLDRDSTHEQIKLVIDLVKGTPNFAKLFDLIMGLLEYMKKWPEPVGEMSKVFWGPANVSKLQGDELKKLCAWLMQLDAVIYEYDPDDEGLPDDDPEKPDAE